MEENVLERAELTTVYALNADIKPATKEEFLA